MPRKCQHKDCETLPTFGIKWKKPTHCREHASPDMKNVVSKRCQYKDCETRPSFGIKWKQPTHCKQHASPNMKDVVSKRCQHEGCESLPSFGIKWKQPTHCKQHASPNMKNVVSKRCQYKDCETRPSFGIKWKQPTHCKQHASPNMKDVVSKRCQHEGCESLPSFGIKWKQPTHCKQHASPNMKDVVSKRCQHEGCESLPSFGIKWKQPTHCREHASPDMKDVVSKRCQHEDCESLPSFGDHINGKQYCSLHYDKKKMWKVKTCDVKRCNQFAIYSKNGLYPYQYCDDHYPSDFKSNLTSRCKKCNLSSMICDEEGLCLLSCTKIHKERQKFSENEMKKYFKKNNIKYDEHDTIVIDGCSKKRPDFIFKTNYGVLIVENDENQHKSRPCECEQTRMIQIHQDIGENLHFIRFNPDKFIDKNGNKTIINLKNKHKQLGRIVKYILKNSYEFFSQNKNLSVRYMYYDGCDQKTFNVECVNYL